MKSLIQNPHLCAFGALLALAACTPDQPGNAVANAPANAPADNAAMAAPTVDENQPARPAPSETESLPEPKGPIGPKSAEAAGQVMQHYGALIEQGKWDQAARSWTDAGAARQFRASLEDYPEVHLLIGKPTDMEGAAGSIFITVPTSLDLVLRSGERKKQQCSATLRRVNDVPGSTAEQRRWHIQSIDC